MLKAAKGRWPLGIKSNRIFVKFRSDSLLSVKSLKGEWSKKNGYIQI